MLGFVYDIIILSIGLVSGYYFFHKGKNSKKSYIFGLCTLALCVVYAFLAYLKNTHQQNTLINNSVDTINSKQIKKKIKTNNKDITRIKTTTQKLEHIKEQDESTYTILSKILDRNLNSLQPTKYENFLDYINSSDSSYDENKPYKNNIDSNNTIYLKEIPNQ